MRLALCKNKGNPIHAIGGFLDKSPHCHSELIFSDGISGSSSMPDGGVRLKKINYTSGYWDFYTLPNDLELQARNWFQVHHGKKGYDVTGNFRFIFGFIRENPDKIFCHESIGYALGWTNPWRYGPGGLLDRCIDMYKSQKVSTPW